MDILVQGEDHGLSGLFNNVNNDAYFFKTLGLNGAVSRERSTRSAFGAYIPYGTKVNVFVWY